MIFGTVLASIGSSLQIMSSSMFSLGVLLFMAGLGLACFGVYRYEMEIWEVERKTDKHIKDEKVKDSG